MNLGYKTKNKIEKYKNLKYENLTKNASMKLNKRQK